MRRANGSKSTSAKSCGRWRALADHVHNLAGRQRPVGRALTPEERKRLFDAAASNAEWEHVYCAAVVAANTSMRPVEVKHLRRWDVDLVKRFVHVRRSKNETSHRVIPLNASAIKAATRMFERADLLGHRRRCERQRKAGQRRRNRDDCRGRRRPHVTVCFCRGPPPSGKLLIPLARRDVRVVEGARLEIALAICDGVLRISITVAKPTT